ncbi:hypothetical protein F2S72_08995 [Pseudomonas syringae pv. actinidiae]|nr:hypothetical protein [Pseudomonas syringae pv. actinidiae]
MTYTLTAEQIGSITDVEFAFATERLLPAWAVIPEDFKEGNQYTKLASAIFYDRELPNCTIELNEGVTPEMLNRCIRAHLASFSTEKSHKIAGVGFMIACASTVTPNHDIAK